jgi:2-oxoglutarate ferredoxin oxidoreductase subunit beta
VHDNRCFALTTGQFTATSPQGFKGKSTPQGSSEEPFDPLQLMLASKASFIARGYSGKIDHLEKIILAAIKHPGFSFVNILQPCVSFFNTTNFYNQRVYEMKNHDSSSYQKALLKMKEWNYQENVKKIPLGIFFKIKRSIY